MEWSDFVSSTVRIVFLGGLGEIGRNCFCLEVDDRIIVVDCGLMFPDAGMPGVDLVLPDFTYLRTNAERVEGIVLTHGHEDHIGALGLPPARRVGTHLWARCSRWGSRRKRITEAGMLERTEFIPVADGEVRRIGSVDCEFVPVTHSVPHAFAVAYHTPVGTVLHTGDFKFDLTPVDGRTTDLPTAGGHRPGRRPAPIVRFDHYRGGWSTPSESTVGPVIRGCSGTTRNDGSSWRRSPRTCTGWSRLLGEAVAAGRKVAFLGRSMIHNVTLAARRACSICRRRASSTSRTRSVLPGRGLRDLHRIPGRTHERARTHGRGRAPATSR